jgi:hypothetical protein
MDAWLKQHGKSRSDIPSILAQAALDDAAAAPPPPPMAAFLWAIGQEVQPCCILGLIAGQEAGVCTLLTLSAATWRDRSTKIRYSSLS